MNENVRNRTPIYSNKSNTKLAVSWPKVKTANTDAYEKKSAKNKKRFQKSF